MASTDDFLEHHGVKGMKWGHRKVRSLVGDTGRTRFQKPPSKLSDVELKRRINRMELEKRYNDLNGRDVSSGEAAVTKVLSHIGTETAKILGTAAFVYAGKLIIEKKFGEGHLKGMFPKKK